jgi:hypothetical protein
MNRGVVHLALPVTPSQEYKAMAFFLQVWMVEQLTPVLALISGAFMPSARYAKTRARVLESHVVRRFSSMDEPMSGKVSLGFKVGGYCGSETLLETWEKFDVKMTLLNISE